MGTMTTLRAIALIAVTVLLAAAAAAADASAENDDTPSIAELEAQRLRTVIHTINRLRVNGDEAGAVAAYRKGLAIRPSGAELRAEYDQLGAWLAARAVTKKLDAHLILGLLEDYEAWLSDTNTHPTTLWWLRSFVLRDQGRTDEADALVADALAYQPESASYHWQVALYLVQNGFHEAAITEYEHGLPHADEDFLRGNFYIGLAAAHVGLEQYDKGVELYEKTFELLGPPAPNNTLRYIYRDAARACWNLGRAHELRGRLDQTVAANERALAFMPNELDDVMRGSFAANHHAIGEAYVQLDNPNKALEHVHHAIEMAPDAPDFWSTLGDAYAKAGDDAKAQEAFAKCVDLYRDWIKRRPTASTPCNGLAWHYATHDEHLDEALELSKKSLELTPDTPEYLDTLAEIYHRMGDHDEAIEWIKKALDLDRKPKHSLYYEQQLDKFEKAQKEAQ